MAYYKKALEIIEQLAAESEAAVNKLNLSIAHNKIGHILKHTSDLCDAADQYLKAYEISVAVYKESPTIDAQRQLMVCSAHLATFHEEQGNFKKALQLRFVELDAAEKAANATNAYKDLLLLSTCYNNLAHLLYRLEKTEEALSQYKNAYNIRSALSAQFDNSTLLSALNYSCGCIAETYLAIGNPDLARMYYQKSVDVCKKWADKEASLSSFNSLGTAYVNLASVESGEAVRSLLEQASSVYEKLCLANPQNQRFRDDLAAIRDGIADIDKKNTRHGGFFKKLFKKH